MASNKSGMKQNHVLMVIKVCIPMYGFSIIC